jgi:hypothetical protein
MVSASSPRSVSFQERLSLNFQRLALSWHAMRFKRGRAVSLRPENGLIRVDDGVRKIYVPHVRRAKAFSNGINTWLEAVAAMRRAKAIS